MSNQSHTSSVATSRTSVKLLAGLLFLALIVFVWLNTGGSRHWQISAQHIDEKGQLSAQAISQLKQLLIAQDAPAITTICEQSPRLMDFISSELNRHESQSKDYLAQLIELAFLAKLNEQENVVVEQNLAINIDAGRISQFQNELLGHRQNLETETSADDYAPSLDQQELLASSARFLAAHYHGEQLDEFREMLFDVYQADKQRRSAHRAVHAGLLQAMWISSRKDNPHWIKQYLEISNANNDGLALNKESDLMKLLHSEQPELVINTARVIGSIGPQHAVTSLRYHLAKAKNQRVKFALLDAIGQFGEEVDVLEPQLKRMQQITSDEDLRHKIKLTLDQLRGKSA